MIAAVTPRPLLRPEYEALVEGDRLSRAARRLIADRPVAAADAHRAMDLITEAIGQLEAARAALCDAYPGGGIPS